MEAKKNLNINMRKLLLFCLGLSIASARVHHLKLEEDNRKQITVSTFGFLTGGTLAINITAFSFNIISHSGKGNNLAAYNQTIFGFTLDKSKSPGLSSYMEGMQDRCILDNPSIKNENNMESVFFTFDFKNNKLNIERVGPDMQNLRVTDQPRDHFLIANHLNRRDTDDAAQNLNNKLSDSYLLGNRRRLREAPPSPTVTPSVAKSQTQQSTLKPDTTVTASTTAQPMSSPSQPTSVGVKADPLPHKGLAPDENQDYTNDDEVRLSVDLNKLSEKSFQTYFLVHIRSSEEEGLYNLFFHNCMNYNKNLLATIDLTMDITEDNNGNFLTAGEMPVPVLYFTFCVLYFIAGVAWLSVLRKSTETVYKIHYLMLVVVFVKSLACMFHGVNMHFIQISGIHEDAWAILWYIVYLTRGALMFVTVLLIGAGWAFIKHVLTDREKKLFLVIIPLQMLNGVAEVIVQESEEGNQSYSTWKEIFILVDLLCCGAVLFPVVWSIRHLQEASTTDGKAAINLQKLKLFRHFYILVVCYIYFTRIIVYLMKITLPYKLEWLTDLFTELAMLFFFCVTGYKFRPATDNPYLQVPQDSEDEIEMEEVLTKTGDTEQVVRVNQKTTASATEGSTNQIKQRECSHDYD